MPVLGLASCVLVLTQQTTATLGRAGLLLCVGVALYLAARSAARRAAA